VFSPSAYENSSTCTRPTRARSPKKRCTTSPPFTKWREKSANWDQVTGSEYGEKKAAPIIDALHTWMIAQRQLVPEGSAIAKALDYSLKRWIALTRYLDDGVVPIDNNWRENQIRPWALGRSN